MSRFLAAVQLLPNIGFIILVTIQKTVLKKKTLDNEGGYFSTDYREGDP